jgi:hypothetical protein
MCVRQSYCLLLIPLFETELHVALFIWQHLDFKGT